MKPKLNLLFGILLTISLFSALAGCSSSGSTGDPHLDAIIRIRKVLDLPVRPLTYVQDTFMANSPDGRLAVAWYTDDEGRAYYVDVTADQVVEVDARSILPTIPINLEAVAEAPMLTRVNGMVAEIIPNFDDQADQLTFSSGTKGDNYYYDWRGSMDAGNSMPRLLQFGIHKSGILFAYMNTLLIEP